jgi:protease IV
LDPFSPESMEDRAHLQIILNQTHQQFIARVKEGRGDRLRSDDVFDGRIWNGETALGLGLIDSLAGPDEVARDLIGAAERVYYVADEPLWQQVTRQIGVGISVGLSQWLQAVGQPVTR